MPPRASYRQEPPRQLQAASYGHVSRRLVPEEKRSLNLGTGFPIRFVENVLGDYRTSRRDRGDFGRVIDFLNAEISRFRDWLMFH